MRGLAMGALLATAITLGSHLEGFPGQRGL